MPPARVRQASLSLLEIATKAAMSTAMRLEAGVLQAIGRLGDAAAPFGFILPGQWSPATSIIALIRRPVGPGKSGLAFENVYEQDCSLVIGLDAYWDVRVHDARGVPLDIACDVFGFQRNVNQLDYEDWLRSEVKNGALIAEGSLAGGRGKLDGKTVDAAPLDIGGRTWGHYAEVVIHEAGLGSKKRRTSGQYNWKEAFKLVHEIADRKGQTFWELPRGGRRDAVRDALKTLHPLKDPSDSQIYALISKEEAAEQKALRRHNDRKIGRQ